MIFRGVCLALLAALLGTQRLPAISEPGFELGLGSTVSEDDTAPDLVSKPYRSQSLRGRSFEEIAEWMYGGSRFRDYARQKGLEKLPPAVDLWTGSIEEVAVRLLERERAGEPGKRPPVRIPKGYVPPASGWVLIDSMVSDCTDTRHPTTVLRWEPGRAWIVWSMQRQRPADWAIQAFAEEKSFDLGGLELDPAEARRVAGIVVLLGRARFDGGVQRDKSTAAYLMSGLSSEHCQVGSDAGLELPRLGGAINFEVMDRPWPGSWRQDLAASLASRVVGLRLLRRASEKSLAAAKAQGKWPEDEEEAQRETVRKVFSWAAQAPANAPLWPALVQAVGLAGHHRWQEFGPAVEALAQRLPPPGAWERQRAALEAEIQRAAAKLPAGRQTELRRGDMELYGWKQGKNPFLRALAAKLEERKRLDRLSVFDERGRDTEQTTTGFYNHGAEPGIALRELRQAIAVTRRQWADGDDTGKLAAWAKAGEPGAVWAYARLRQLDAPAAQRLLEAALVDPQAFQGEYGRVESFKQLREKDSARAAALRESLPKETLERLQKEDEEAAAKQDRLLLPLRAELAALAGESAPDPQRQAERERLFDAALEASELPDGAVALAEMMSGERQERLRQRLADRLVQPEQRGHALWLAWISGLRPLAELIRPQATSSPADFEAGENISAPKQRHRLHLARQVLSLWEEPDAATRARLLLAFCGEVNQRAHMVPAAKWRLERDLRKAIAEVSPPERAALATEAIRFLRYHGLARSEPGKKLLAAMEPR